MRFVLLSPLAGRDPAVVPTGTRLHKSASRKHSKGNDPGVSVASDLRLASFFSLVFKLFAARAYRIGTIVEWKSREREVQD